MHPETLGLYGQVGTEHLWQPFSWQENLNRACRDTLPAAGPGGTGGNSKASARFYLRSVFPSAKASEVTALKWPSSRATHLLEFRSQMRIL